MEKQGWGLGGDGFPQPGKYGLEREIRATGDGCSLSESCSPVLLTWRFVAVMNILTGIVELPWAALYSAAAQHKVDSMTLRMDGWIFFCSPALLLYEIHCLCNRVLLCTGWVS